MSFRSGQNSDAKKLMIRLPPDRGEDELYALDRSQIKSLLSISESIGWKTRHYTLPSYVDTFDKLQAFADETRLDLMTPVDFCSQLSTCIDELSLIMSDLIGSNQAFQDAMIEFITNNSTVINQNIGSVPSSQLATNLGNVTSCNPDLLFNVCNVAIDLLNTVSNDIFETIEIATNAAERSAKLVSAIPVIGAIVPFDEILLLADDIVSTFYEAYNSAYTLELADTIKCGIFCLSKPDCELNINDIIAYYEDQFNHSLPQDIFAAIIDLCDFLATGTFSGDTIVYGMHLLVLTSLRTVTGVSGQKFATFATRLIAAGDTVNNDWKLLCEDCPPDDPCNGGDNLATNANGWTSATGSADYTVYHVGEGFGRGNLVPNRVGIRKSMPIAIGQTVTITWLLPQSGQMDFTTFNYSGKLTSAIIANGTNTWIHVSNVAIPDGFLIDMYPSFSGANFDPLQRVICIKVE